jgi:hypothetical protein
MSTIIATICSMITLFCSLVSISAVLWVHRSHRKQTINDLEIRFHKDANVFGEHGTINVTHVRQGLVENTVRFVIVGLTTPPNLSKEVFNLIWEAAKAQGYIPHHIVTYGRDNDIVSRFPIRDFAADFVSAEYTVPEARIMAAAANNLQTKLQNRKGAEDATQLN